MLVGGDGRSHKLSIGVFLTLACLMMPVAAALWAQEAPNEVPENGFAPPLGRDGRVDVRVGLYITNLIAVEEVRERFDIAGYLFESWKDPRLAFQESGAEAEKEYKPNRLWTPNLVMANRIAMRDNAGINIRVRPDGTVDYLQAFEATLSTQFDLRTYPFDNQGLEILIQPFLDERQVLNLMPQTSHTGVSGERWAGLAQWGLQGITASTERPQIGGTADRIPEVEFLLHLKRRSAFHIWRIGVPLLVIVMVSYCALWITTYDHFAQITVALSSILTTIAFLFVISASLPGVPYLTYLDGFYLTCFVFTFFTLCELVLVHRLLESKHTLAAQRVRRHSRWFYPLAFVLCNLVVAAGFFGI
jgi:Neurotransmitter-gated ion-channel ligand binding domain